MIKTYHIRIEEEVHNKLKVMAATRNTTMSEILMNLVIKEFDETELKIPSKTTKIKLRRKDLK